MGILDKIMFWRKKDEFANIGLGEKENLAFGDEFGRGQAPAYNLPGLGQEQGMGQGYYGQPGQSYPQPSMPSFPSPPRYQQPSYAPQQDLEAKNLEIISSKLDALRASIESLNQRLANLEAIARGEEDQRRRRYY